MHKKSPPLIIPIPEKGGVAKGERKHSPFLAQGGSSFIGVSFCGWPKRWQVAVIALDLVVCE
jgi:hypothetical protein